MLYQNCQNHVRIETNNKWDTYKQEEIQDHHDAGHQIASLHGQRYKLKDEEEAEELCYDKNDGFIRRKFPLLKFHAFNVDVMECPGWCHADPKPYDTQKEESSNFPNSGRDWSRMRPKSVR